MSPAYPLLLNLTGKRCLIVGGGDVAFRKVTALLQGGGDSLHVVSPEIKSELIALVEAGQVTWTAESFQPAHLDGAGLVFAATDSRDVNASVVREAQQRGVWVNSADAPETSDFVTPAVVRRGGLCLTVNAGGNPLLAAAIADELTGQYGPEWADLVELFAALRLYIQKVTSETSVRRAALTRLRDQRKALARILAAQGYAAAHTQALALIAPILSIPNANNENREDAPPESR